MKEWVKASSSVPDDKYGSGIKNRDTVIKKNLPYQFATKNFTIMGEKNGKFYINQERGGAYMKILAITACTAGIAHTYIAKEKIRKRCQRAGR